MVKYNTFIIGAIIASFFFSLGFPAVAQAEGNGSGGLLGSGSLVIFHNACNVFSSGEGYSTCTQWDTTIEIPAMAFFVKASIKIAFSVIILVVVVFLIFKILWEVCRFFFRIITQGLV